MPRPGLFADENIYQVLVEALRRDGWDVVSVRERGLAGATDETVLEQARREERVLLTFDRDFADLRYLPRDVPGILLLRFRNIALEELVNRVSVALGRMKEHSLRHHLVVITQTVVRRRSLASSAISAEQNGL